MRFSIKNITKDLLLTLLGIILSLGLVVFVLILVVKKNIALHEGGNFLALCLPIVLTFFSFGGRTDNERL